MSDSRNIHPQYTREQLVAHCKKWLDAYKYSDDPLLLTSYLEATIETDVLTYPIATQKWVSEESEPELWAILTVAGEVNHNHSDPRAWEKLVKKVEAVVEVKKK